jgi:hypothetical protein
MVVAADWTGDVAPETVAFSLSPGQSVEGLSASAPTGESGGAVPQQAPAGARALSGVIDRATWTVISGWARDPETPDRRVRLELVEGETPLATVVASDDRPDLALAGVGDGRHGFAFALAPGLLSLGRHVLELRCADTGAALPGSPIVLEPPPGATFRWYLDGITDTEATGWIATIGQPSRRSTVALKEGGRVVARAVASRFRDDLRAAGIGDGCHAFGLQMPRSLLNGEVHLLEIVEEDTGFALTEQPVPWRSTAGTAGAALTGSGREPAAKSAGQSEAERAPMPGAAPGNQLAIWQGSHSAAAVGTRLLVDVSDLVYYIGHHPNLTGIQRVQSSIVLSMVDGEMLGPLFPDFPEF